MLVRNRHCAIQSIRQFAMKFVRHDYAFLQLLAVYLCDYKLCFRVYYNCVFVFSAAGMSAGSQNRPVMGSSKPAT